MNQHLTEGWRYAVAKLALVALIAVANLAISSSTQAETNPAYRVTQTPIARVDAVNGSSSTRSNQGERQAVAQGREVDQSLGDTTNNWAALCADPFRDSASYALYAWPPEAAITSDDAIRVAQIRPAAGRFSRAPPRLLATNASRGVDLRLMALTSAHRPRDQNAMRVLTSDAASSIAI